jgi:hypothetical protein
VFIACISSAFWLRDYIALRFIRSQADDLADAINSALVKEQYLAPEEQIAAG